MEPADRIADAPAPKVWSRSDASGWASPRWYLAFLVPFEIAIIAIAVRGGDHHNVVWKLLTFGLLAVGMAALVGNAVVSRHLSRQGWVPVKSRADVAGIKTIGRWYQPTDDAADDFDGSGDST